MLDPRHVQPPSRRSDFQQAVAYLYDRIDYERTAGSRDDHLFRLERTEALFQQLSLGDYLHRPADASDSRPKVPLIHIAGTKGKGSTATMVSQILTAAGYRVGLYTSPHLTDLEERFRIDGVPCSRQDLIELVECVAPVVDRFDASGNPVSFFELTTAMAVLHFDRNDCDVIVLEVGLGGRLDSTNVCASTIAAITSIGLDHQRILGDTIAEIATEKAGIIKAGVPVVSGAMQPEARQAIRRAAERSGSRVFEKGGAFDVHCGPTLAVGSEFVYQAISEDLASQDPETHTSAGGLPLFLALDGAHQVHNAAIAISIIRLLNSELRNRDPIAQRLSVSDQQIADALRTVRCTGRFERFSLTGPSPVQIILDTAHNQDSILALCQTVDRRVIGADPLAAGSSAQSPSKSSARVPPTEFRPAADRATAADSSGHFRRPVVVVFGTSRDKDVGVMAAELAKIADEVICTRYTTNPRAASADHLLAALVPHCQGRQNLRVRGVVDPQQALREGISSASPGGTLVICGSFFLAGELRPRLLAMPGLLQTETSAPVAPVTHRAS
ncbi:Folylpolyglutamate synthase [Stieleria maiorica]|uniref:Dihydrofolate synthase/folylpolyglutamate synthase n=1 Tax=Stieleria maiorica TaxID=2795974 RepID=A0A5B9MPN3_9BACT|nr:folylpolyglutamate synthase/dihydrofolate synthase family protein [Stieleria maiorica]QEG01705.1 Folylpolyglutamate synthase [Stieleria maiorica]